jgi:hypothetical protein
MSKTHRRSNSKSNTRVKRQARAKAARASRREALAEQAARRRLDELFGDVLSPERSAALLLEDSAGGVAHAGISRFFVLGASTDRARAVSRAVTELAPGSLCALTLAADVAALIERDARRASGLLDQALARIAEDVDRIAIADHLVHVGRPADALAIVDEFHRIDPEDEGLAATRAAALEVAYRRVSVGPDAADRPSACACWSGRPWTECCRPAEEAAIAQFLDRKPLGTLRTAIERFVSGQPTLRVPVADDVRRWLEAAGLGAVSFVQPAELQRMAEEHAWLIGAGDGEPAPMQRFDPDSPLASFALDESTPTPHAIAARRWLDHHCYGLWQIVEPVAEPGVWLTEIVTGITRYVALPTELLGRCGRWSVLLGGLVAVDGTWRPGSGMVVLSPHEADEAVDLTKELLYRVLASETGEELPPHGLGQPHGVLASVTEPSDPLVADFTSKVIGSGMPQLLAFITELRDAQPRLVNTDQVPVGLLLGASGSDEADEAWPEHWPDQELPALGGMTPRRAARSESRQPWLEALLREFEHDADQLARQGGRPPDIESLRVELDMPVSAFT